MDLDVEFEDIELSPLTPYSGKYVGYAIEKGKLTMELKYFIDHRKLDAKNKFFFDQLMLGIKSKVPMPRSFLSNWLLLLLKDRNGEIEPGHSCLGEPQITPIQCF